MNVRRSSVSRSSFLLGVIAGLLFLPQAGGALAADTEDVGDVLRVAIPAAAFAVTLKRDDQEGRRQFYKSFGATVGGTWALKEIVEKERPDGSGDDAFPSGHAATAFQGAAFLHRRYGIRSAWWAYVLASYTAWTRVDADEHDNADVLAGAAVGIASSFALAKRRNIGLTTMVEGDTIGLRIFDRLE